MLRSENTLLQEMSVGYLHNIESTPCIYISGKDFSKTDGITQSAIADK
jgi:hypothetical protein